MTIASLGAKSPQNPGKITNVELLGHSDKPHWKQDEPGLKVSLPGEKLSDYGLTLKITMA